MSSNACLKETTVNNIPVNVSVSKEALLSSEMIKDYKEEMIKVILNSYPDMDREKLEKIIDKKLVEKVKEVPVVSFINNYRNTNKRVTLLKWYDWYKKAKPITTEHGVCYKKHSEAINLAAKLLDYILNTRKFHKKEMFKCKKAGDFVGESFHNTRQKVFKIFANSYYGTTGNTKSIFYNLYTALSITGKGQSLITNAAASFESFFTDNIYFNGFDDVLIYISNIKNETRTFKDSECLSKQVSKKALIDRLVDKFSDKFIGEKYRKDITEIVMTLSKKDVNRIYYKNNLYAFCSTEKILNRIYSLFDKIDSFKDPNEVPEEIQEDLNTLWSYMKEFVYYPHTYFNHTANVKEMSRKCVAVVDTDSNMLNIEPWVDFLISKSNGRWTKDTLEDEDLFKMVNIIAFILGHMIGEVHERYTSENNVPEDKRSIINMKNEFLMRRLLLTSSKKNYAAILLLQEGALVDIDHSLDIKGLTIKKSNVNKNIGIAMQNILENDLLKAKDINISTVLSKLSDLEKNIRTAFDNCETTYAKPDKANAPDTYKEPFQMQPIRGIYTWNALYPNKEITFPAQVNTVKINGESIFDINDLEKKNPNFYDVLKKEVYNNPDFKDKGFTVLAIPKTETKIPEWLRPYINTDQIIFDSLNNFNKILESIGVLTISTSANEHHYSNIIDF
jgi:DNA polymerase elongation subunit (family B)